jgi:hypothetical protein
MAALDREAKRIKVPIGEVAVIAYRAVFGHPGLILELGWLPLLVMLAAAIGPGMLTEYSAPHDGGQSGDWVFDILGAGISLLCINFFAVRWHQAMLLVEPRTVPRRLLIGAWLRFLLYTLIFNVVTIGLLEGFAVPGPGTGGEAEGQAPVALAAAALVVAISLAMTRCSLLFPAAARGRPVGWLEAWRTMRGNTWRLIGTTFLVVTPVILLVYVILNRLFAALHITDPAELAAHPPPGLLLLGGVLEVVLTFLFVALVASILSEFYRRIVLRSES